MSSNARKIGNNSRKSNPKKQHRVNKYHADKFEGASHAKGIVADIFSFPNGTKAVKVILFKNGERVVAHVPYDGLVNIMERNDNVLLEKSKITRGAGCKYSVVKVEGSSIVKQWRIYSGRECPARI
jgi:ribosomal protein S12